MKLFWSPLIIFSWTACSEPFSVDRHDLTTPRIIGVRQSDGRFQVQVWNGTSIWQSVAPDVEWLGVSGTVISNSVSMEPTHSIPSMVRYIDEFGGEHLASVDVQQTEIDLTMERYNLGDVSDVSLEARLTNVGMENVSNKATESMRLVVRASEEYSNARMRWMSAFGRGTFLERSALETDFFQEEIVMDREEVLIREPQSFAYTSTFGLMVNGQGHNQWLWSDMWYESASVIRTQGRMIQVNGNVPNIEESTSVGFLISVVDTDWGIELHSPTLDVGEITQLPCTPTDGEFQLDWLAMGICILSDVDGQWVILEVD